MSFQSLDFLSFLVLTVLACTAARRAPRLAEGVLTVACAVFYVLGDGWRGLAVLALSLLVTAGVLRCFASGGPRRRTCFALAALWHVGVLVVFKYTGFLTGGAVSIGWAPLGLSFFTFQQLWLLKESYTGAFRLEREARLPLYALFFPTAVSGPIWKPGQFFPQLEDERFLHPTGQDLAAGLYAIAWGMAKKVLLADNLGVIVNNGWSRLEDLSAPAAWLVILGYTLQLYLDFSGYCDIAAGSARLLGIRIPVNFNSPYRSLSMGEFWKRWHITLTGFLRECVYFPLGGSRKGAARAYCNIMIVYLVSGLWHGAGWTFLVWGALHGLAQIGERAWGGRREKLPAVLRWALTFAFVNLAWVFFRAPDLLAAFDLLKTAVSGGMDRPDFWLLSGVFSKEMSAFRMLFPALDPWLRTLLTLLLYGGGMLTVLWPHNVAEQMETFRPTAWRCTLLALLAAWSVLSFTGVATFIYSNF